MFKIVFALFLASTLSTATAKEYGNFDLKRLLTVSETPSGKKHGFDGAYLDQILNDLSAHAKNYPAQFDTAADRQRATQDVKALSGMFDILINVPTPSPALLVRAGYLNSIGHNLGIAGSAEKANSIYQRLLAVSPSDPRGNYMYGTFLSGVGKPKEALPYLEKALALGVAEAAYSLGMTHLSLGDRELALKNLEDYKRQKPSDGNVDKIIDGIRNGRIEIKRN